MNVSPRHGVRDGRNRLRTLGPVSALTFLLALLGGNWDRAPQPAQAQSLQPYGLVNTWTNISRATRVVAGIDGDVRVVAGDGSRVERRTPTGVVVSSIAASGVQELAVDDVGSLYALNGHRSIMKYGANGVMVWSDTLSGEWIPPPQNERLPFTVGVAWNPTLEQATVAYDFGNLGEGGSNFKIVTYTKGGVDRPGFTPQAPTDVYWDIDGQADRIFLLNRTRNSVEVYQNGTLTGLIPFPEPVERIAPAADGSVFGLARRRWIYKVAPDGSLLAVWDALDPTPDPASDSVALDLDVDGAGFVYVADPARGQVRVYAPDVDPGAQPPDPPEPPSLDCQLFPDKFADPTRMRLGGQTMVTLRLDGGCPEVSEKADVVLVVDVSASMDGDKLAAAKDAVELFVGQLMHLDTDHVALVTFESTSRLAVGLTNQSAPVIGAARSLTAWGGTDIAGGIDVALAELASPRRRPDAKPIIILLTDGKPTAVTGATSLDAADRARYFAQPAACRNTQTCAVTLYAIGLGSDVDPNLLRIIATTPEQYFFAPGPAQLGDVYSTIARRIYATVLMKTATIVDYIPDNMTYIENSAVPPAIFDRSANTLTWPDWRPVPFDGIQMTYWLQPEEVGEWPTNIVATYDGTDGLDMPQHGPFPIPHVIVIDDTPTPSASPPPSATFTPTPTPTAPPSATVPWPTPTPTVPSPTATPTVPSPTPTVTRTPSPTPTGTTEPPTPTPTMTPGRYSIYVVVLYNNVCFKRYTDVTLVLDASTTMLRKDEHGVVKLDAAKAAAREFLATLSFTPDRQGRNDQASIVWFNETAAVEQPLTSDRASLDAALDRIHPVEGSRIDLGLDRGRDALFESGRHAMSNTPVLVLLSDGIPNHTTFEAVYVSADKAKRDGARLYAVGLGLDVQEAALRRISSQPEMYYYAPTVAQLATIYRQIAGQVVCR